MSAGLLERAHAQASQAPKPRRRTGPTRRSLATPWAVYLGANTPERLALEMGITIENARRRLRYACRQGLITARAGGGYRSTLPEHVRPPLAAPRPDDLGRTHAWHAHGADRAATGRETA